MRGTQPAAPAVQQGGYAGNGNQGGGGRRGITPTTPLFPGTNGHGNGYSMGPVTGVHDCLQPDGGKPLYLCQP